MNATGRPVPVPTIPVPTIPVPTIPVPTRPVPAGGALITVELGYRGSSLTVIDTLNAVPGRPVTVTKVGITTRLVVVLGYSGIAVNAAVAFEIPVPAVPVPSGVGTTVPVTRTTLVNGTWIVVVPLKLGGGTAVPGKGIAVNQSVIGIAVGSGPVVVFRKGGREDNGSESVRLMAVVVGPQGRIEKTSSGDGVLVAVGSDNVTTVFSVGVSMGVSMGVSIGVGVTEMIGVVVGSLSSSSFQPKMRAKKSLITCSPVRDLNACSTSSKTLPGSSPRPWRKAAESLCGSSSG